MCNVVNIVAFAVMLFGCALSSATQIPRQASQTSPPLAQSESDLESVSRQRDSLLAANERLSSIQDTQMEFIAMKSVSDSELVLQLALGFIALVSILFASATFLQYRSNKNEKKKLARLLKANADEVNNAKNEVSVVTGALDILRLQIEKERTETVRVRAEMLDLYYATAEALNQFLVVLHKSEMINIDAEPDTKRRINEILDIYLISTSNDSDTLLSSITNLSENGSELSIPALKKILESSSDGDDLYQIVVNAIKTIKSRSAGDS